MNATDLSIGLAFAAGLASFLSPCVFSLVPVYIGYLNGQLMPESNGESNGIHNSSLATQKGLPHGIAFVLGFSVVFVALGAAASAVGNLLYDYRRA